MAKDNIISMVQPLNAWMQRARTAMENRQYLSAARWYHQALKMQDHPVIRLEMAYAYFSMHCYETVYHHLYRALQSHPLDGEFCFLLALCAINKGDVDMGRQALQAYLCLDPEGDHRAGVQEMLEHFPWHKYAPPLRGNRARALLKRNQSTYHLCHAARVDPTGKSAVLLSHRLMKSHPQQAMALLQQAQKKGVPRSVGCLHQATLMEGYLALGYPQEAQIAWSRACDACETFDQVEQLVDAAIRASKAPWAEELLDDWLLTLPDSVHLHRLRIRLFRALGQPIQGARQALKNIDPDNFALRYPDKLAAKLRQQEEKFLSDRIRPFCLTQE